MRQKYDHLPMRDVGFKRACILTSSVGSIPVHGQCTLGVMQCVACIACGDDLRVALVCVVTGLHRKDIMNPDHPLRGYRRLQTRRVR